MTGENNDRLSLLQSMGIRVWLPRSKTVADQNKTQSLSRGRHSATSASAVVSKQSAPTVSESAAPAAVRNTEPATSLDPSRLDWNALAATVSRCQSCNLHRGRTQTVFGTGNRKARWMIIGEAPGAEEDRQGEPFVGRAGQLLNSMLQAAGFQRRDVYIANIVKCRPPDNRDPRAEEAAACSAYLDRQIELIKPQIILAVGRVAAQTLLKNDTPVGRMRGKLHHYGSSPVIPVVVTYHPAYLLRAPKEKRKAWQDLLFALEQSEVVT